MGLATHSPMTLLEIVSDMRVRRTAALSASGRVRAAGWWRRAWCRMGYGVVLILLLAGMLPSWPISGVMSTHALLAEKDRKDAVIVEVARGDNPQAVARALGVVPTHVYSEV